MSEEQRTGTDLVTTERGTLKARDMKIGAAGINFTNAAEVMAFANMMSQAETAVRPQFRNKPGACLAIIDDSIRFGMSPFFLARKAYLVNDEIAYEAQVVAAIIIARAPIKDRPDYEYSSTGGDLKCKVTVETITGKVITHESPPVKDIKVKNSPLWVSDPQQQLGYYTVRAMARRHFPDVLGGIYDIEEAAAARARDVTPEPEERPRGRLQELLAEGAAKKAAERAEPSEKPDTTTQATQEAQGEAEPEPSAESAATEESEPAATPEAAKEVSPRAESVAQEGVSTAESASEKRETSRWKPAEQDLLDKLIPALAALADETDLAALQKEYGPSFRGKSKAFVQHANELVEARRKEVAPVAEASAAAKLL